MRGFGSVPTLLSVDTLTSALKDNKLLRSLNTVEIKVFKIFLLVDRRIRILEAQKLTDPEPLKVHKRENFLGSDIEICTFS